MESLFAAEESQIIEDHIRSRGITIRMADQVRELIGKDGRIQQVQLETDVLETQFVGVCIGVRPNIDLAQASGIACERGILADEQLRTNVPNVYAVGDCVQLQEPRDGRRAIEAVWYTGRMMGKTVAESICESPVPYDPGIWFNSAKFFDLEYQTYGDVPANPDPKIESLFWEHRSEARSIRINFKSDDRTVTGFCLLGIRYRHEVCEHWIADNTPIERVLSNLGAANFDPEFFPEYESHLVEIYNRQHPATPVQLKRRRGLMNALKSMGAVR